MSDNRPRFARWQRWIRRRLLGLAMTRCIKCVVREQVGPDLLCGDCLADPDVRECWIDDDE